MYRFFSPLTYHWSIHFRQVDIQSIRRCFQKTWKLVNFDGKIFNKKKQGVEIRDSKKKKKNHGEGLDFRRPPEDQRKTTLLGLGWWVGEFLRLVEKYEGCFWFPLIGGRWHIIPQLAVYTTYIPLIYCQLVDYISLTTY